MTTCVKVSLRNRSYNIMIGHGLILRLGSILKDLGIGKYAVVVTNKNISRLYGKIIKASLKKSGISSTIELVPDSEKAKSENTLLALLNKISSYDTNKSLFLVALGGGVVGDLTGFTASIYKRGIPYVQVPTTLLSQVDSAIGGKTAIDMPIAKNLVGSFYQPKIVISDISILRSLSKRQINNGLAECIKYGIIKDAGLFSYLEKNYTKAIALDKDVLRRIIVSCSRIKSAVVKEDEFDNLGKRIMLNFGHTIGHAIEGSSGYSNKYNHGEAIAIGMICAASISYKMGLINTSDKSRIEALIRKCGLPIRISGLKISRIYDSLLRDKKFVGGKNRFVLPVKIGKVRVVDGIKRSLIVNSIKELM